MVFLMTLLVGDEGDDECFIKMMMLIDGDSKKVKEDDSTLTRAKCLLAARFWSALQAPRACQHS